MKLDFFCFCSDSEFKGSYDLDGPIFSVLDDFITDSYCLHLVYNGFTVAILKQGFYHSLDVELFDCHLDDFDYVLFNSFLLFYFRHSFEFSGCLINLLFRHHVCLDCANTEQIRNYRSRR